MAHWHTCKTLGARRSITRSTVPTSDAPLHHITRHYGFTHIYSKNCLTPLALIPSALLLWWSLLKHASSCTCWQTHPVIFRIRTSQLVLCLPAVRRFCVDSWCVRCVRSALVLYSVEAEGLVGSAMSRYTLALLTGAGHTSNCLISRVGLKNLDSEAHDNTCQGGSCFCPL